MADAADSLGAVKEQRKKDAEKAAPANKKKVAEKADLHVAINTIRQIGEDGKPEDVLPGTPFYPAQADLDFLLKHVAVRPADEAETALYERQNPASTEAALG